MNNTMNNTMNNKKISVAIPHYNNTMFINDTLLPLINDDRIGEIIIRDDKSNDFNKLIEIVDLNNKICNNKIKLFQNITNIGCYHNKLLSINDCSYDWTILLDSDNIYDKTCIDVIFNLPEWNTNIIYAPMWANTFPGNSSPNLNYSIYTNQKISKDIYLREFNNITFQCLINTCNYFLPVKNYVNCMKKYNYERCIIDSLDSAVLFSDWILNKNNIFVVNNLIYKHRLHPNSNYNISSSRKHENNVKHMLFNKIYNML